VSLVLYRELGDKRGIAYSLRGLGWVAQTKGHNSIEARSLMEEYLAFCWEAGDKEDIVWALANLGRIEAHQGDFAAARFLHVEQAYYTTAVAAVRMHLEEQTFHSAWTQGRTMAIEQVLATNTACQGLYRFAVRPLCMLYSRGWVIERAGQGL